MKFRQFRPAVVVAVVVAGFAGSLPSASAAQVDPPMPVITGLAAEGPNGFHVSWRPGGEMPPDASYVIQPANPSTPDWGQAVATRYRGETVTIGPGPGVARVWTQTGGTGQSHAVYAHLYRTWLESSIPSGAVYGRPTVVTGTVSEVYRDCAPATCGLQPRPDGDRLVLLLARQGTGWATVASTRTSIAGRYRFSVATPGTRQYLVATPSETTLGNGTESWLRTGELGRPATTTAWFRVLGAKFLNPTVTYGQRATAYTKVLPPVDGRVMLQRRTSTGWASVTWVPLNDGVAAYSFASRIRGQVGYRFYLPAASYAGRSIAATATSTFVLTTR